MKDFEQRLLKVAQWQCRKLKGEVGVRTPAANECRCSDGFRKCPLKFPYPTERRVYRLGRNGCATIHSKWFR